MINAKDIKAKAKKLLRNIIVMTMILNISMPSFFNIVNASITTNLPTSEIRYNATDNSTVFPESYKAYIRSLKSKHPSWIFKAVYTGLDWTESIRQESYEVNKYISLVPNSYSNNWKTVIPNTTPEAGWSIASKKAIAYTMDPRNFLNDSGIFQFEALDFNSETSTTTAIGKVISGTAMSSYPTQYKRSGKMTTLENSLSWAQLIINAAKNSGGNGISAVFLASRMKQETSLDILNNGSINGSSSTYPGVYNFLNICATPNADGTGSITNGLRYAKSQGWTTPQTSINAGAINLWSNYIKWGQNTVYFQKFDVSNVYGNAKALYAYQYMTNILAPSSEAKITYNAYLNSSMLDSNFVFYIPVYDNMPTAVSAHPDSEATSSTITGTDIIYLDDGESNGTDYFNIRSGAGSEYNTIAQISEAYEGAENRTKYTRTQIGTNGWDKIRLSNGTEGYVYQEYVKSYSYTHVTGITVDKSSATLKAGESTTLVATIAPTNAYIKNMTWSSSNNGVATVDSSGKVTAVGVGTANITAKTLDGNKIATCAVTVGKTLASSISIANAEYPLVVGKYITLSPTVLPITTTDKSYDISIADASIAIVESGKIKGLKVGETTVTLTTKDGSNKTCTFKLKVMENVATVNNLTVDTSSIITKVGLGTTSASIKGNISTTYTKKLININNTVLNDIDKVGTGTRVQILNGTTVLQEYTIVIYGDISGDGVVNSLDLLKIRQHMLGTSVLSSQDCRFKAANTSRTDTVINSLDLLKIKQQMLGISSIQQ